MAEVKSPWTKDEIRKIYFTPLIELIHQSHLVHRNSFNPRKVQKSTLLSIKTGACSEDCGYCAQSSRYKTQVVPEKLLPKDTVVEKARQAKEAGATRFCMGAAWRQVKDGKDFDQVLEMVSSVAQLGLQVCCTLDMLTENQARRLKEAGLYAYNHNIDTSEAFYSKIITTRTFQDRLNTIQNVRKAGITVCSGVILGLGETEQDHIDFLHTLCTLEPHPESVPINTLVPIQGTPLQHQKIVDPLLLIRVIATARILMPKSMVRLSAGRLSLSPEAQLLCFYAGANSIFSGEKLLTTPNPEVDQDTELFEKLGMIPT